MSGAHVLPPNSVKIPSTVALATVAYLIVGIIRYLITAVNCVVVEVWINARPKRWSLSWHSVSGRSGPYQSNRRYSESYCRLGPKKTRNFVVSVVIFFGGTIDGSNLVDVCRIYMKCMETDLYRFYDLPHKHNSNITIHTGHCKVREKDLQSRDL